MNTDLWHEYSHLNKALRAAHDKKNWPLYDSLQNEMDKVMAKIIGINLEDYKARKQSA